jgi:hypothetical protein
MSYLIPREGRIQLLTELLGQGARENWLLCLYHSAVTLSESLVAATLIAAEATFSGYSRKTLTRQIGSPYWSTPALQAPSGTPPWSPATQVAHAEYGTAPQSWTRGAASDTIHGYFIIGATSGKLIVVEALETPRALTDPADTVEITPIFENA